MSDDSVQAVVRRPFDIEIPLAYVVDGFVVDDERAVCMVHGAMRGQNRIVRFYHDCRHLSTIPVSRYNLQY